MTEFLSYLKSECRKIYKVFAIILIVSMLLDCVVVYADVSSPSNIEEVDEELNQNYSEEIEEEPEEVEEEPEEVAEEPEEESEDVATCSEAEEEADQEEEADEEEEEEFDDTATSSVVDEEPEFGIELEQELIAGLSSEEAIASASDIQIIDDKTFLLGDASTPKTLCFTSNADGSKIKFKKRRGLSSIDFKISTDGGTTWSSWDCSELTLNSGEKLYVKGDNSSGIGQTAMTYSYFIITGNISASGNIMGLLDDGACNTLAIPSDYCFRNLFYNCTGLVSAPEIPATTFTKGCFENMFNGCTNLIIVPFDLEADTMYDNTCYQMFCDCTNLATAPNIRAKTLGQQSCLLMFGNCTSLVNPPEIDVEITAYACFSSMFQGCTNLATLPDIKVTDIAEGCLAGMFSGTKVVLKSTPSLGTEIEWKVPAATSSGVADWNLQMFSNCNNVDLDGSGGKEYKLNTTYYTSGYKTYTVTFNTAGGSSISSLSLQFGSTVATPSNPTKSGYTFVNWYSESSYTNVYDFNSMITKDTTIYAKWNKNSTPTPDPTPSKGGGSSSSGSSGTIASIKVDEREINKVANDVNNKENISSINFGLGTCHKIDSDKTSVSWSQNPTTGKWNITLNENGNNTNAANGFYIMPRTVTFQNNQFDVDSTYYFDEQANMHVGWLTTPDKNTYYFDTAKDSGEGTMVAGWKQIDEKWYYFERTNGILVKSNVTPDGYQVDANGVWIK